MPAPRKPRSKRGAAATTTTSTTTTSPAHEALASARSDEEDSPPLVATTIAVPASETLAWAVLPASAISVPESGENVTPTASSSYVNILSPSHVGTSDWTAIYCSSSLRGALRRVPEVFRAGSSAAVLVALEVGDAAPLECFLADRDLFPLDNARAFQSAVKLRDEMNKSHFNDKLRPEDPLLPTIGREFHMAIVFRAISQSLGTAESTRALDEAGHPRVQETTSYCECAVPYSLFESHSVDSDADGSFPLLKTRLVARLKRDDLHEERVQFVIDAVSGAEISVSAEEKCDMEKLANRCRDPTIEFDSYLDAFFGVRAEVPTPQRRLQFSPMGDLDVIGMTTILTTDDGYEMSTEESTIESPRSPVHRRAVDDASIKSALKSTAAAGKLSAREDASVRKVTINEGKKPGSPRKINIDTSSAPGRHLTNTIIASDGNEYHIEPHCLPPPREIAKFLRDFKARRDQGYFRMTPAKPPPPTPMVRHGGDYFNQGRSSASSTESITKSSSSDYADTARSTKKASGDKASDDPLAMPSQKNTSLKDYLLDELFGLNALNSGVEDMINNEDADTRSRANIETFIGVPPLLERLIWFGMAVCLESFLYVITILLLRSVYSLFSLLFEIRHGNVSKIRNIRTHMFNICRGGLVLIGCLVLNLFNMSRVYHVIRTQNTIKLYAFTSMLEVFDRLLGSFGQDAMQYLHAATRRASDQSAAQYLRKIVFAFVVAAIYVAIHSSVYFVHIATLTVAVNTADKALITVLIINNFAEIKSFAFKKFDKEALFIMSCSDITERFQIFLFFILIAGLGVLHSDATSWTEHFVSFSNVLLFMFGAEMLADWIKHAFVAKFNKIGPSIYKKYARILRADITYYRKESIMLDYTHSICRRIGLAQIPLACLFFRFVLLALHTPSMLMWQESVSTGTVAMYGLAIFAATVLFKIAVSHALFAYVRRRFQQDQIDGQSDGLNKDVIERLATIEKYSAMKPAGAGDSPEPRPESEKSTK